MTLKEKFRKVFKDHFSKGKEEELLLMDVDDDLEQIADDYAIEFAEWCCSRYAKLHSVWCPIFGDQRDKNNWRTTKELLEIFKKEKGL
jgi:hypothetical protein